MGDRGNIIIEADGETFPHPVFFYTHWCGSSLPAILKAALKKGKERWDDPAYLARVLFQQMIGNDSDITGFGISTSLGDGGTEVYVNMKKKSIRIDDRTSSFKSFCE